MHAEGGYRAAASYPRTSRSSWSVFELGRKAACSILVASLFRVTIGFGLAVVLGIPIGLLSGWFQKALSHSR